MRIAVLPFNASQGTSPALARQLAAFVAETTKSATGLEINAVSYLAQIEQEGQARAAFVNVSETLNEADFMAPLFADPDGDGPQEAPTEKAMDGLLSVQEDGSHTLTYRFFDKGVELPSFEETLTFTNATIFETLNRLVRQLTEQGGGQLPEELANGFQFGTEDGDAFVKFLEGYDALNYIQQANGAVAMEFSPDAAYTSLLEATKADLDFVAPYETLCALTRTCGHYRLGTFESAEAVLKDAAELVPDDFKAMYSLGELYGAVNLHDKSAEAYEKALKIHEKSKPDEEASIEEWKLEQASIYSRVGVAQMNMGMPVNAELNFRKAIELEGDDKPSINTLAAVLAQTNRAHEVPALWKQQLERQPNNPEIHAKYAISLFQADREKDAVEVFEKALVEVEENIFIKRFYAPLLAQQGDLDRAMDFYEDCIDVAPTDVPLLVEYARTLSAAERDFEVPAVLENILKANPDQNTRAEILAWKTELTEPRRAEVVKQAEEKMSAGDFEGAVKELRPLRNWLADYWKLWAVLAAAHNRLEEPEEAKEAAEKLITLFPGCEPAYAELMAALSAMGQYDQAFNVMQYAASQMPQSIGIQINLALAAKRAGHEDLAKNLSRQLREAIGPNQELEPVFAELES